MQPVARQSTALVLCRPRSPRILPRPLATSTRSRHAPTSSLPPSTFRSFHSSQAPYTDVSLMQIVSPKLPVDPSIAPELPPSAPPRVRFAPSPTGQLHLGGLRTALFNHLFARRFGGKWILRLEDTDQTRLVPGSLESMQEILHWAGLDWDEGPGSSASGSKGPYVQSQRLDIYKHYSEELIKSGNAYRDFRIQHGDSDLEAALEAVRKGRLTGKDKKQQMEFRKRLAGKGPPQYVPPDEKQAQSLIQSGKRYCVRLKTEATETKFHDGIFGRLLFKPDIGAKDPVLMKMDGWPTYHLASVIDDHLMGVTHVLRGEEWLPSVPKHLALYSAFGFKPPTFLHLPLLMNKDGTKLSKKTKDVNVSEWRDGGFEPDAVLNYISLMGYNHHGEEVQKNIHGEVSAKEVFTLKDLIENFDPLKISRHRAVPFPPKLDFLNKRHLLLKVNGRGSSSSTPTDPPEGISSNTNASEKNGLHSLYLRSLPLFQDRFPTAAASNLLRESYLSSVIEVMISRVFLLKELPEEARYFFEEPDYMALQSFAKRTRFIASLPHFVEFLTKAKETLQVLPVSQEENGLEQWKVDRETLRGTLEQMLNQLDEKEKERESKSVHQTKSNPPKPPKSVSSARTDMLKTLRFALFGGKPGPDTATILFLLGRERSLNRLEQALRWKQELEQELEQEGGQQ